MPNNMFEYHLAGFKRGLRDMLGGTTSNYQQYGEKTALDATELGLNKNYKPKNDQIHSLITETINKHDLKSFDEKYKNVNNIKI